MSDFNLKHIARLARLHFREEELKVFESQIQNILSFVEKLKEADVSGIEATSHPLKISNVFREDETKPSISIEEFLRHAPAAHKRFFEVPKVVEDR